MKKYFLRSTKFLLALFTCSACFLACNKNNSYINNVVYPDQVIYLSQAAVATVGPGANGIYSITANIYGQAQRFSTDGSKFIIPLGIIKSGISTKGTYTVAINANTDTVGKLLAAGKFNVPSDPAVTTELLPASAFTLPASVDITDGSTSADFSLPVDLNFLVNSFTATPKKRYAIGVTISNSGKSSLVKPSLSTVVILIDTRSVIPPAANFSTYVYKETKTANFVNVSSNGAGYSWNYGDGAALETTASPSHIYAAAGTYTVTLTTTGIAGSGPAAIKTATVVIQ